MTEIYKFILMHESEELSHLSLREGDHVVYFPTGAETNPTSGVITKIIHERQQIGSKVVRASDEMPRYVISNDKTHKETAYKLENIIDKVKEGGSGEEIEETGEMEPPDVEVELEEGDEIYDPSKEEEDEENGGDDEEEEYEEFAPEIEKYDEKEIMREASEIDSSVRIS